VPVSRTAAVVVALALGNMLMGCDDPTCAKLEPHSAKLPAGFMEPTSFHLDAPSCRNIESQPAGVPAQKSAPRCPDGIVYFDTGYGPGLLDLDDTIWTIDSPSLDGPDVAARLAESGNTVVTATATMPSPGVLVLSAPSLPPVHLSALTSAVCMSPGPHA
jgi:hypothetical protein